ncbi:sensor histidine kinase [Roseateles sp. DAIF2]|uniref:histidine kinase n=1 Tax=Roseateles sp. DAIF2 TaxID=2714952 RepID=UPI0018A275F2|nr:histidine kinase [Roseateles sp. DAIF2]QPF72046.1 sensor histidine kinase [Roseateles sp. DAIF2]
MNAPASAPRQPDTVYARWQALSTTLMRAFRTYANWLVGISWKRFAMLSLLLLVGANVLQAIPPFTWRVTERIEEAPTRKPVKPAKPAPAAPAAPPAPAAKPAPTSGEGVHYEVTIDERGVRVVPRSTAASAAASAAPASSAASALPAIEIRLPESASRSAEVRDAIAEAKEAIQEAVRNAEQARHDAEQAKHDAEQALRDAIGREDEEPRVRVRVVHLGDFLMDLAVFIVIASAIIKITYKGRIQAEVKAAQATETAEAESLKRQVVEARMAAMQAQVEPHFLFNTLASIDHLIETDPPRASQMQKNLIALLRASMPTMREANANGGRDLGRELAVIRPYLEILKVRMEERLQTEILVPEGLLSAEFPQMMIQGLVENAIKHGLEPKAEGGKLTVKAEIVHGKLAVTVADTGLGFGRAATSGTGVGLANIRERLMLLYGPKAGVTVSENQPSGTVVTITVPYRSRSEDPAAPANTQQGATA